MKSACNAVLPEAKEKRNFAPAVFTGFGKKHSPVLGAKVTGKLKGSE